MITYKNDIVSAYCCGHEVKKIVACGEVVFGEEPTPEPTDYKLKMLFDDGKIGYLPCDSTSAITSGEVQQTHSIVIDHIHYYKPYSAITAVWVGDCVTNIGDNAFKGMSNLQRVNNYGYNVTRIGNNAFSGCTSLWGIFIGCNTTTIGNNAFNGCIGAEQLNICGGVQTIGDGAFRGLTSISGTVDIPDSVTTIGSSAFYGMTNVTTFKIRPTTPPTLRTNSFAFHYNGSTVTADLKVRNLSNYQNATGGWAQYYQYMSQL